MAQALPSFVELLASLDLESDEKSEVQHYARYPISPSFDSSSPSSSLPSLPSSGVLPGRFSSTPNSAASFPSISPSIVISQPSPVDPISPRRRSTSKRYNPYVPSNVFTRRSSLPGDLSQPDRDYVPSRLFSSRASSASPPLRRASLGSLSPEPSIHSSTCRITMSNTDQPISSLVRRRRPHSSPQSPDFHRTVRRSVSPTDVLGPVTLPSLPPLPRISMGVDSPASPSYDMSSLPPLSSLDQKPIRSPEPFDQPAAMSSRMTSRIRDTPSFDHGNYKA